MAQRLGHEPSFDSDSYRCTDTKRHRAVPVESLSLHQAGTRRVQRVCVEQDRSTATFSVEKWRAEFDSGKGSTE